MQIIVLSSGEQSFVHQASSQTLSVGDQLFVPLSPPDSDGAWRMFGVLDREVVRLERALIKARCKSKTANSKDINECYRAVRKPAPQAVDVLSQNVVGTIAAIDHADCAIEFQDEVKWLENTPIFVQGQKLQPVMVTPDKIWLEAMPEVQEGMSAVQHKGIGTLPELFHAFTEQWNRRWARHSGIGLEQWQTIIDFNALHFRSVQSTPLQHSRALFRATVASKKKNSARGLDGVSRLDLLHLDDGSVDSILSLFARAHSTGDWPDQVTHGSVASLAKVPLPETVSDFRPITVFSGVYRAWSSMGSRHWLKEIEPILAEWLFGNRQATRAMTLWREVIDQVEQAYTSCDNRHGIVFDLEKAYNTIPRLPVMALAKMAGISHDLLLAWSGALRAMERHFQIRNSYSPGVRATCALPEGCGLSCLAMLLIDQAFHLWLNQTEHWVLPLSYVDNWEAIVSDVDAVARVFDETVRFAESLDLTIDASKTHVWSTCPHARKQLRSGGFTVKLHCRDLGAHVVYSKQVVNTTTIQRINDLALFWDKLYNLRASHTQKLRLVRTVAWPRAFHAISAVVLGKKRFHALRSHVMHSLRLDKAGANSHLQLLSEGLTADPHCFAILETIRDFRDLGHNAEQVDRLTQICLGHQDSPYSTVSQVLCQRLHQLGFHILADGWVSDKFGTWHLLTAEFGEVQFRIQEAWIRVVAEQVAHRNDFNGMGRVDVVATRTDVHSRPPTTQGTLRRCLNGTTNTFVVCKWSDSGKSFCPECGQQDSLQRRLWDCPFVSDLRNDIPQDLLQHIDKLPPCCRLHGWTVTSDSASDWYQLLDSIPQTVPNQVVEFRDVSILDLFTDGSALWPQEPRYRVASWAVVQASPFGLDVDTTATTIIAAGPLGGVRQSAYCSELFAVLAALTYAAPTGKGVRIWTDCLAVIRKFTLLVDGSKRLRVNSAHADLWQQILDVVGSIGKSLVRLIKVPAHETLSDHNSAFDNWLAYHNNCVDVAAKAANTQRGDVFWKAWKRHARETDVNLRSGVVVRDFLAQVAMRWVDRSHSGPDNTSCSLSSDEVGRSNPSPSSGQEISTGVWTTVFGQNLWVVQFVVV